MITVVLFFIISSFIYCINRKNKGFRLVALTLLAVMMIFTCNNPDYAAYELTFSGGPTPFAESIGFIGLCRFINCIGIHDYRFLLILISLFIIYVFYKWNDYCDNTYLVVYLYTLFIMYYDIIQIRNAIVSFLTLLSLLFYIKGKNILYVIIPLLIAPLFHAAAVFVDAIVIYVLAKNKIEKNRFSKLDYIPYLIISVFTAVAFPIIRFLIFNIPQLYKNRIYFTGGNDWQSFVIWFSASVILLFVVGNYGVRYIICNNSAIDIRIQKAVDVLYSFALFAIPLSFITLWMNEVVRFFRLFYLALFFLYAIIRDYIKIKNRYIIFGTMALINIVFMLVWLLRGINPDAYWG